MIGGIDKLDPDFSDVMHYSATDRILIAEQRCDLINSIQNDPTVDRHHRRGHACCTGVGF